MRTLTRTTWLELKLFAREPLTVIFTLALPVLVLYVLGGVFGDTAVPGDPAFRGVGAMTYYVPAYVGLVIASMGLIGLPVHLASYRERGVLRRFRASSMPLSALLGAQLLVTLVAAALGSVLVVLLAAMTYEVTWPSAPRGVAVAFLLGALAFSAFGILLGAVMPTARAAQGAGLLLWFLMLMIAGAGPPPGVLPDALRSLAELTPLRHVIIALQDPWLGFGTNLTEILVVCGILLVSSATALRFFRWE